MAVSKPVVSRALDRLGQLGLTRRKIDAKDRRNVLVQRTVKGSVYLSEFGDIVRTTLETAEETPPVAGLPTDQPGLST
jgi:DNA-binding MarR family transcriptional regulator